MSSSVEPEGGRWAAIARKEATVAVDVPLLKSTAGLKTVVVDANAIIGGSVRLAGVADQFVTVREVLEEVRDSASRFHLATLPVAIRCLAPSSEALAAVIKFSRATGDFQSLSSVDLKLTALVYTLEAEVHGMVHIRSEPPPLLVKHSSSGEKDPPGWGAVENPDEWDFIEENERKLNVAEGLDSSKGEVDNDVENPEEWEFIEENERKLNVAEGLDSSKGEVDDSGWQRASCRSTRRNYLKREAKRAAKKQAAESASAETPYKVSDVESEESWMMTPLWNSSIACMTADFAMQNVLLQMGLRLLSTNGMHIRELNKWVVKCQACNHVVSDVGRIFCSKCGNGGTLFKVSVTVGQNGTVHAQRAPRVNLRGTRYSLPMPKGGREGAAQNPILREDQLPRVKKAGHFDGSVLTDVNFTKNKRAQKLAGVKTAAAVFGGRRNPNERRSSLARTISLRTN